MASRILYQGYVKKCKKGAWRASRERWLVLHENGELLCYRDSGKKEITTVLAVNGALEVPIIVGNLCGEG